MTRMRLPFSQGRCPESPDGPDQPGRIVNGEAGGAFLAFGRTRAFRLGVEELSEAITTTVNAALDAAREQAGLPGDVDLSELSGKLEEIQQQSVQRLQSFMSGLVETQAQVVRAAAEGQRR